MFLRVVRPDAIAQRHQLLCCLHWLSTCTNERQSCHTQRKVEHRSKEVCKYVSKDICSQCSSTYSTLRCCLTWLYDKSGCRRSGSRLLQSRGPATPKAVPLKQHEAVTNQFNCKAVRYILQSETYLILGHVTSRDQTIGLNSWWTATFATQWQTTATIKSLVSRPQLKHLRGNRKLHVTIRA